LDLEGGIQKEREKKVRKDALKLTMISLARSGGRILGDGEG
jgi:hypothetical protein